MAYGLTAQAVSTTPTAPRVPVTGDFPRWEFTEPIIFGLCRILERDLPAALQQLAQDGIMSALKTPQVIDGEGNGVPVYPALYVLPDECQTETQGQTLHLQERHTFEMRVEHHAGDDATQTERELRRYVRAIHLVLARLNLKAGPADLWLLADSQRVKPFQLGNLRHKYQRFTQETTRRTIVIATLFFAVTCRENG